MNPDEVIAKPHRFWQRRLFWFLLVIVLGVAAGVVNWKSNNQANAANAAVTAVEDKGPTVLEFAPGDLATVKAEPLTRSITVSGTLTPSKQATVKSTVAGEVRRVLVREGEVVKQGAVLAEVDVADAHMRLEAAIADQAERRARMNIASRNRDTNLGLLNQNFISQNAFDQLHSTFQASEASVQWAEAQVRLAKKSIDDAVIRAPMDGVVAKRLVNGGERVMPDAPMMQLVDLTRLQLEATVPVGEVSRIAVGQAVRFRVDGFGERSFEGKVERINPIAEVGSRAIKLFIQVPNPQGFLRGGMFAQGGVSVSEALATAVIPSSAVFEEAGQAYVFSVLDGKLVKQAVTLGLKDEASGSVGVIRGLATGQQLVRVRMTGLKAGISVVLQTMPAKAAS